MKEQEAIDVLKMIEAHGSLAISAKETAIQALKEIQQYKAIGTVQQCKEAMERTTPKNVEYKVKSYLGSDNEKDCVYKPHCPNCNKEVDTYVNACERSVKY